MIFRTKAAMHRRKYVTRQLRKLSGRTGNILCLNSALCAQISWYYRPKVLVCVLSFLWYTRASEGRFTDTEVVPPFNSASENYRVSEAMSCPYIK